MIDSISRPAIVPPRPRSAESPSLWILLLAGSLLLHIAFFLILRPFWVERAGGQGGSGAVEIELVDTIPATGQTSLSPKSFSPSANPIAPAPIAIAPSAPLPENDPEIQALPRSQPTPAPSISPSFSPLNSPLQGQPKANSKPNLAPSQPTAKPNSTPESAPPPPVKATPTSSPSPQLLRSREILPIASTRSNEMGDGSPQRAPEDVQATVRTENPQPEVEGGGGLRLTIVGSPQNAQSRDLPTTGSDAPDQLARTDQNSVLLPEILNPPSCVRRSSGVLLTLWLLIDRTGRAKSIREPSDPRACNSEYIKQFVENLVSAKVHFRPAQKAGGDVDSTVEIKVKLTVL